MLRIFVVVLYMISGCFAIVLGSWYIDHMWIWVIRDAGLLSFRVVLIIMGFGCIFKSIYGLCRPNSSFP